MEICQILHGAVKIEHGQHVFARGEIKNDGTGRGLHRFDFPVRGGESHSPGRLQINFPERFAVAEN